jgi:ribosome-associated protein YbcJ (S4-like RNA binding protein)
MVDFISVKVNDSRLIKELPRFFRDAYSYVIELAQNAYRSGATRLSITATEGIVQFTDNGHGIDDPIVIFTVAESAWENSNIAIMDPAGMGLFAAFFAANRIKIRSIRKGKGWYAEFSRDDILSLRPIKIYHKAFPDEPNGVTVTLYGSFQPENIKYQVQQHIQYFTNMYVTFNGQEIKQEDFLESGGNIAYRKNIAAGELVLYNRTCQHRHCNHAIFHGQVIEIPQPASERLCFRLAVKENGLPIILTVPVS